MQMTELDFETPAGLRLVATGWGDENARAVLLLHGGGQTRQSWSGTAERLAVSGRYAVALDMRGHGESAWCPEGRYRVANFAADLAVVLEQLPQPAVECIDDRGDVGRVRHFDEREPARTTGLAIRDNAHAIDFAIVRGEEIEQILLARLEGPA